MLGQFYQKYEDWICEPGGRGLSRETYACLLLAEILDRVALLSAVRRTSGRRPSALTRALDIFLRDADEARVRGLRANLFCRTEAGALDPWSIDPMDDLQDLGGSVVSAAQIDPTASVRV